MTCFWDGILNGLKPEDYQFIQTPKCKTAVALAELLKSQNRYTRNVHIAGAPLTETQMAENHTAVSTYRVEDMGAGYLCPAHDYFLALVSELFHLDIHHNYNGFNIMYRYTPGARRVVHFTSDAGHFENGSGGILSHVRSFLPSIPVTPVKPVNVGLGLAGAALLYTLLRRRSLDSQGAPVAPDGPRRPPSRLTRSAPNRIRNKHIT